jgi:dihydrofolate synthase / folylpolyglutamate synthase
MADSDIVLERLLHLHPKVIDLSLGRIETLLADLKHPERRVPPVIHIAGTNGKGSTAAHIRAMLEAHGRRVHFYSSPHLVRFHERIQLAGPDGCKPVSEAALAETLAHCERVNDGRPITFFEITTSAAFLHFANSPADYLVLEVGLGGRLDATNVIARPAATVITPISTDHPQFLGDTLEGVAFEKAGILKSGVTAIVAPQADAALQVIKQQADRVGAFLSVANEDWQCFGQQGRMIYQDAGGLLDLPLPKLPGRFQIDNAGTAIATLRSLSDETISPDACAEGLANTRWPARMQRLTEGPLVDLVPVDAEIWLDGGHNPAAGQAIADAMAGLEEKFSRPLVMITGMINSKDAGGYLHPFADLAHRIYTVSIPGEANAIAAGDLADIATRAGLEGVAVASIKEALEAAGGMTPSPRILICGSLYLAGHVLHLNGA